MPSPCDKRVKAVVASTMYDMTRVHVQGLQRQRDPRTAHADAGATEPAALERRRSRHMPLTSCPTTNLKGGEAQFLVEYADYYRTPRGYHPRAVNSGNAWTVTTPMSFMNMPILTYIEEISPRPILFVHGEKAHSRYYSGRPPTRRRRSRRSW